MALVNASLGGPSAAPFAVEADHMGGVAGYRGQVMAHHELGKDKNRMAENACGFCQVHFFVIWRTRIFFSL